MPVKATGASATSVKRIVGEEDGNKPPGKSWPKRKKVFNRLDEFDLGVIRRMMYSFYILRQWKKPNISRTALET